MRIRFGGEVRCKSLFNRRNNQAHHMHSGVGNVTVLNHKLRNTPRHKHRLPTYSAYRLLRISAEELYLHLYNSAAVGNSPTPGRALPFGDSGRWHSRPCFYWRGQQRRAGGRGHHALLVGKSVQRPGEDRSRYRADGTVWTKIRLW